MTLGELKGTGVALVTPFDESFAVDYNSLGKLLAYQSANNIDYFVVHGTTGESPTTSIEEKNEITAFVKKNNPKNLPIVIGIGGNNTFALIDQIKSTDFQGITALLSVSPYYNKPSQAGIINHYQMIADASPVPVILYNVPGRTASNLTVATTLTLAQHPNIMGIKEASGDVDQCLEIVANKPDDFLLISGDDMLTVDIIEMGGFGVISVLANAFPQIFKIITNGAFAKDPSMYKASLVQLSTLNPHIYKESSATGIKIVLDELGLCKPYVRPPLYKGSGQLVNEIKRVMEGISVST